MPPPIAVALRIPDPDGSLTTTLRRTQGDLRWNFCKAFKVAVAALPLLKPKPKGDDPSTLLFALPETVRDRPFVLRLIGREQRYLQDAESSSRVALITDLRGNRLRPSWVSWQGKNFRQASFYMNAGVSVEAFRREENYRVTAYENPWVDNDRGVAILKANLLFLGSFEEAKVAVPDFVESITFARDKLYCHHCNHAHYFHLGTPPMMMSVSAPFPDGTRAVQRIHNATGMREYWKDEDVWVADPSNATRHHNLLTVWHIFGQLTEQCRLAPPA